MEARIAALQKENELLKTQLQQSETQRQSAVVQLQKYRRQFADDGTLALDSLSDPSSGAASGVNGASGSAGPNSPAANNLANIGMQMAKLTRVGSNSLLSSSPRFSAIGAPQSPSFGSASSTSASSSSASGGIGARLSANPPRLASGSPTAEQTQSAAASPTSASSSSDSASDSSSSTALQTLSSSSTSSADASSSEKSSDDKAASAAAVKQRGESVDKSSNTEESGESCSLHFLLSISVTLKNNNTWPNHDKSVFVLFLCSFACFLSWHQLRRWTSFKSSWPPCRRIWSESVLNAMMPSNWFALSFVSETVFRLAWPTFLNCRS